MATKDCQTDNQPDKLAVIHNEVCISFLIHERTEKGMIPTTHGRFLMFVYTMLFFQHFLKIKFKI